MYLFFIVCFTNVWGTPCQPQHIGGLEMHKLFFGAVCIYVVLYLSMFVESAGSCELKTNLGTIKFNLI